MDAWSVMHADFLIIGQGLAGTCLAWRLLERGKSFLIVDRDEPLTSSKVAAGLVSPVTGMRVSLNWRYAELYPEALRFYQDKELLLHEPFFHLRPIVRLLRNDDEVKLWRKRQVDPAIIPFLNPEAPDPLVDERVWSNPLGGFQQKHCGWLDSAAFLAASKRHFQSLGRWAQAEVRPEDVTATAEEVTWNGRSYGQAVWCQGWEALRHPYFDWVPLEPARGTVLTLRCEGLPERRIVNRGCWMLPMGDGTWRAGSTYEPRFIEPHTPGIAVFKELEARLRDLVRLPFQITGSQTAVRPVVMRKRALIGRHPARPRTVFLNGLGSKGVLRGPFMARRLTEHLLDGTALEGEYDLQANP